MILVTLLWVPNHALASETCDNLKADSPYLYGLYCAQEGGGASSTKPAASNSSFGESFKINPAGLPTENSAYGLEIIPTRLDNHVGPGFPNLAIIKGFHRFGTGLSTNGGNTFYSNDLYQRVAGHSKLKTLDPPETAKGSLPNLNLGTSFLILDKKWLPRLQLGLSGRYNKITNTLGGGPALLVSTKYLTAGYGVSREKVSNYFPYTYFQSLILGLKFFTFEVEFNQLMTPAGATTSSLSTSTNLPPVQILTATYPVRNFMFTVAGRKVRYLLEGEVVQYHFSVQYFASSHLAIGFMHNYIPGGTSLGLQIYL